MKKEPDGAPQGNSVRDLSFANASWLSLVSSSHFFLPVGWSGDLPIPEYLLADEINASASSLHLTFLRIHA
jgi:hypothetical protein